MSIFINYLRNICYKQPIQEEEEVLSQQNLFPPLGKEIITDLNKHFFTCRQNIKKIETQIKELEKEDGQENLILSLKADVQIQKLRLLTETFPQNIERLDPLFPTIKRRDIHLEQQALEEISRTPFSETHISTLGKLNGSFEQEMGILENILFLEEKKERVHTRIQQYERVIQISEDRKFGKLLNEGLSQLHDRELLAAVAAKKSVREHLEEKIQKHKTLIANLDGNIHLQRTRLLQFGEATFNPYAMRSLEDIHHPIGISEESKLFKNLAENFYENRQRLHLEIVWLYEKKLETVQKELQKYEELLKISQNPKPVGKIPQDLQDLREKIEKKSSNYKAAPAKVLEAVIRDKKDLIRLLQKEIELKKSMKLKPARPPFLSELEESPLHPCIRDHYIVPLKPALNGGDKIEGTFAIIKKPQLVEEEERRRWEDLISNPDSLKELRSFLLSKESAAEENTSYWTEGKWQGFSFEVVYEKGSTLFSTFLSRQDGQKTRLIELKDEKWMFNLLGKGFVKISTPTGKYKRENIEMSSHWWQDGRWSKNRKLTASHDTHISNALIREWAQMVLDGRVSTVDRSQATAIAEYLNSIGTNYLVDLKGSYGHSASYQQAIRISNFLINQSQEQHLVPSISVKEIQGDSEYKEKEHFHRLKLAVQDLARKYREKRDDIDYFLQEISGTDVEQIIGGENIEQIRQIANLSNRFVRSLPEFIRTLLDEYDRILNCSQCGLLVGEQNNQFMGFITKKCLEIGPEEVEAAIQQMSYKLQELTIKLRGVVENLKPFMRSQKSAEIEKLFKQKIEEPGSSDIQQTRAQILCWGKVRSIYKVFAEDNCALRNILKGTEKNSVTEFVLTQALIASEEAALRLEFAPKFRKD